MRERMRKAELNRNGCKVVPDWLTIEQRDAINALYREARRLTKETGIQFVVHHIWPLRGKNSCGLHVPWNLEVITGQNNDSLRNEDPE